MTAHVRRSSIVSSVLLISLTVLGTQAATKPRTVLVLPYAATDLGRDEQWIGEGVAQALMLGFVQIPSLIQIDRERIKQVPRPEAWDDQSALSAARSLAADVAVYGEVRRTGTDLVIQPRYVEMKGERGDRVQLDPIAVADGALMERLKVLPVAYLRALKIPLSDTEAARVQKWSSPTTSQRAFESYVEGRQAAYRGTQDGNEAAIELLGKAVEIDPQFVVAQFVLGSVHQGLGNRWKAAAQFRASTQLDPTYPEPYKALGDLFLTAPRRLFDQAIEAYNKALEIRPFYADAYVGLGDAKAAKGDVDGAVAAYQKALGYNPLNAKVHVSLGKLYYSEKGLYYESVQAYKKAIDLDASYLDARMGLAEVYEDKGLYHEAISEYKKVVDADAKNTGALYNLALVHEKVDPKEAMVLWERYIDLAGKLPSEKDWVDVAKLHLRKLKTQMDKGNGHARRGQGSGPAPPGRSRTALQPQDCLEPRPVETSDHLAVDHDHGNAERAGQTDELVARIDVLRQVDLLELHAGRAKELLRRSAWPSGRTRVDDDPALAHACSSADRGDSSPVLVSA